MAHIYADKITEALACCCLSQLYFQLRDDEKGAFYPMKAESLLARYGEQWDPKNKCTIMLSMANAERKVKKSVATSSNMSNQNALCRTENWIPQ